MIKNNKLLMSSLFISGCVLVLLLYANMDVLLLDKNSLVLGHELPKLSSCVNEIEKDKSFVDFYQSTDVCYHQLHSQGLLNDFQIRRAQYSIQYSSNKIILWMVVILTLSGVVLSGIQLSATYQLAKSGQAKSLEQNQELTIEEGKVIFKSSVTGLFILVFSFAFFYVYIWKVYTIYEIDLDKKSNSIQSSDYVDPIQGGLINEEKSLISKKVE